MSSAVDIQIVSTPNLEKIENFLKDSTYRETIEFSANFNTRLCIERRLRLPFLDPQTRVAQNHSNLFVNKRQRMPGFRQGQIYTYPAQRWRKSRRQYLNKMYRFPDRPFQALRKDHDALLASNAAATGTSSPIVGTASLGLVDPDFNGSLLEESSSLGAFGGDTSDSKDSQQQPQTQQAQPSHQSHPHTQQQQQQQQQQQPQQHQQIKEELPKDWYYDDIDINDVDSLEEPKSPADDEYDYDPRYGSKKRRKRRPGKRATLTPGEGVGGGGSGGGAGRRRSGAGRGRNSAAAAATAANVATNADISLAGTDAIDGSGMPNVEASTPTTSGSGRRSRGSGTRGRRRTKATAAAACDPPSPGLNSEPPSFEMAAAAVGVISDLPVAPDEHADLRNYRKYL